jgi:hypothetical protein
MYEECERDDILFLENVLNEFRDKFDEISKEYEEAKGIPSVLFELAYPHMSFYHHPKNQKTDQFYFLFLYFIFFIDSNLLAFNFIFLVFNFYF